MLFLCNFLNLQLENMQFFYIYKFYVSKLSCRVKLINYLVDSNSRPFTLPGLSFLFPLFSFSPSSPLAPPPAAPRPRALAQPHPPRPPSPSATAPLPPSGGSSGAGSAAPDPRRQRRARAGPRLWIGKSSREAVQRLATR